MNDRLSSFRYSLCDLQEAAVLDGAHHKLELLLAKIPRLQQGGVAVRAAVVLLIDMDETQSILRVTEHRMNKGTTSRIPKMSGEVKRESRIPKMNCKVKREFGSSMQIQH
jgi:hypothetical protein